MNQPKTSITDLKAFASSKGITMPNQSLIVAEVTETRAGQRIYTPNEIKENFDLLFQDIENEMHTAFRIHEEKYGRLVIEAFIQHLIDTQEIKSLDNTVTVVSGYFKILNSFFLSLGQSRRSRAGKTFEDIHNSLFKKLEYPFDLQNVINGKPDFVMPSVKHYKKNAMDCIIFTAKRTVRERWRQIVTEGTRGLGFYLATIDHKVSTNQLKEMLDNRIYLVVPQKIKDIHYIKSDNVLSFKQFFEDHLDPKLERWQRRGII